MITEIIQILLMFVLPVILVYFKIIPFKYRRQTLITVSIVTLILIIYERIPIIELGIRLDNIIQNILPYLIFTIVGVLALIIIAKSIHRKPQENFYANKKFLFFIAFGSILQEFLFRGFLFPKLQAIFGNYIILILVNALLFTLIHIIYSNKKIALITIFFAGIFFASIYAYFPNLILISISHIILNNVALRYNFYREENTTVRRHRINPSLP